MLCKKFLCFAGKISIARSERRFAKFQTKKTEQDPHIPLHAISTLVAAATGSKGARAQVASARATASRRQQTGGTRNRKTGGELESVGARGPTRNPGVGRADWRLPRSEPRKKARSLLFPIAHLQISLGSLRCFVCLTLSSSLCPVGTRSRTSRCRCRAPP